MKTVNANLTVITVHKGPIKNLIKTLKSIDSQILKPNYNIVIARNLSLYKIQNFINKKRKFIINQDKSIYNAMNIGLTHAYKNKNYFIFINSGDVFVNKRVSLNFNKYFKLRIPIVGKQILNTQNNYYKIKNFYFKKKTYLPHGAFFCPAHALNLLSKEIFFKEKNVIDADGIWMNKIISRCRNKFIKINSDVSTLHLGGISTYPTINSIQHYSLLNYKACLKETLKFIIKLLFPLRTYFRIIFYFKYTFKVKNK